MSEMEIETSTPSTAERTIVRASGPHSYVPRVAEILHKVVAQFVRDNVDAVWIGKRTGLGYLVSSITALDTVVQRCESPIEQLVALAFVSRWGLTEDGLCSGFFSPSSEDPKRHFVTLVTPSGAERLLWQQFEVESPLKCRLDFAIECADYGDTRRPAADIRRVTVARIAIECDGHEFHERTPDQAERDRSRDRALTADGWIVLRFTGREIWRDPFAVVNEVERIIAARVGSEAR